MKKWGSRYQAVGLCIRFTSTVDWKEEGILCSVVSMRIWWEIPWMFKNRWLFQHRSNLYPGVTLMKGWHRIRENRGFHGSLSRTNQMASLDKGYEGSWIEFWCWICFLFRTNFLVSRVIRRDFGGQNPMHEAMASSGAWERKSRGKWSGDGVEWDGALFWIEETLWASCT